MKILKLILTFCIILGAIVGVFLIIDGGDDEIFSSVTQDDYEKYSQRFIDDWEQRGDWDEQLFKSHCDLINQLGTRLSNTEPLKDQETMIVVKLVNSKLFAEWASATCKNATVNKYINAVNVITKEDPNAKHNPLVADIWKVYAVYKKAYDLAYGSVSLEPTYDGSTWNSFIEYQNGKIASRDAVLRDNTYVTYLSNITDLKKNLNNLSSKLAGAKADFYEKLAKEIVKYYMAIPSSTRTRQQLEALRLSRSYYEDQYQSNDMIDLCCTQFNQDVRNNE